MDHLLHYLTLLSGVVGILLFAVAATKSILETLQGLRAKERARFILHAQARRDRDLQVLLQRLATSKNGLDETEIAAVVEKLEASIRGLSQDERSIVRRGLRQNSSRGVERFAHELATC